MNVCVVGLWHLGTVTAACLAAVGHTVTGLDFEADVVDKLKNGQPPIYEPDLEGLVKRGLAAGALRFSAEAAEVASAEIVWIAYDTPVDENDRADIDFVIGKVERLFPHFSVGTFVLISSQLPVGTTRRLENAYAKAYPDRTVTFGYSPENLRLGKAISAFMQPDRVVVGLRDPADREWVQKLLAPLTDRIEWMTVESAEMTKHALNAFLAASVTFANEIATLCEAVGADAKEVERGLKSEARIGPKAYLAPGAAFAGGTLARDVQFLTQIGAEQGRPTHLLNGIQASNDAHKGWTKRKLMELFPNLRGQAISVWGLTYKPGTDTLRRSSSIELCRWLAEQGVSVRAHDPATRALPAELSAPIHLCATALETLAGSVALVVATEWPEFRAVAVDEVCAAMPTPLVIDASRFLVNTLGSDPRIRYMAVGKSAH